MAIADMYLKIQGVTGEAEDADHKGEIQIASWSWGLQGSVSATSGQATGRTTVGELQLVKNVDRSSPTLMLYLYNNKLINEAQLIVRKAGKTPLEYFRIELEKARVTSFKIETSGAEVVERFSLGFQKVKCSYTPQDQTGARGGGTNEVEFDAHPGSS